MLSALFSKPTQEQTIALAGVFQAAQLVYQLTKTDKVDAQAMHASLYSLLKIQADDTAQVFGNYHGVYLGLETLIQYFSSPPPHAREVMQYTLGMQQLSEKLATSKYANEIHDELTQLAQKYAAYVDDEREDLALQQELADLYRRTISHLSPRIMVQGTPAKLQDEKVVSGARSALFAGIRAAFLWSQVGGQRLQVMTQRQNYCQLAKTIIRRG